ncbi:hypothetical protein F2Q68_00024915 [Brassica cretica]|uniref:Uncharacterized protein n=1 Tax=Brassica cretica TaxID=69181 RepID=A0A8S9ICQ7_BRACR|nr:hypothetical protein F2Q68_00024915 [Brassica cretica]
MQLHGLQGATPSSCLRDLVPYRRNNSRGGFHSAQSKAEKGHVESIFITSSSKQLTFPSLEETSSRCVLHMTDHSTRRQTIRCIAHDWSSQQASTQAGATHMTDLN